MWASLVLAYALLVLYGHLVNRPLQSLVMEDISHVSDNSSTPTATI